MPFFGGFRPVFVGSIQTSPPWSHSTIDNALSNVAAFGLGLAEARTVVSEVARVVDDWRAHFRACGVGRDDMKTLAQYLDNDRLGTQRRAWAAGGS